MNLEISPEPRKQTGLQGKFVPKRRTWKVNLKDLKRASKQVSYAEVLYIKFYMYLTKLMNNIEVECTSVSSDYFDAILKPQHLYQVSNVSLFFVGI